MIVEVLQYMVLVNCIDVLSVRVLRGTVGYYVGYCWVLGDTMGVL